MSSGTRSAAIEAMHGLRDEQEEAFQSPEGASPDAAAAFGTSTLIRSVQ